MIFNVVINFIEALLFTWFIADFFDFDTYKFRYIALATIVQFITLELFQIINYSGFFLSLLIVVEMCLSLLIYKREIKLNDIFIIALYNQLIIIYVILCEMLVKICPILSGNVIECIICKVMQLAGNGILLQLKNKLSLSLDISKWKVVILFELILMYLLYSMIYRVLINDVTIGVLNFDAILIFILCIMFMYIINLINQENKEKLELIKRSQEEEFSKQKYYAIANVKNEIEALDHRLFYTVFKIDECLKKDDDETIYQIIDYYRNKVAKHKLVIDTGNNIFDILYSVKINEMAILGMDISNTVFITKNSFYDDLGFINFIQEALSYFKDCKYLKIGISENNGFVLFKLIYRDGSVDQSKLKMFFKENDYKQEVMYSLDDLELKGLRITFKMEQNDD